jgi:hypothetical protein
MAKEVDMLIGAHAIVYSKDADADRAFLRDALGLPGLDVGHGWLIFGLPPSEIAVHPGRKNDVHEMYLMVDDVEAFVREMAAHGAVCEPVQSVGWGLLTKVELPGGGELGVYQPRHARPKQMRVRKTPARGGGRATRPTAAGARSGARSTRGSAKKAAGGRQGSRRT